MMKDRVMEKNITTETRRHGEVHLVFFSVHSVSLW